MEKKTYFFLVAIVILAFTVNCPAQKINWMKGNWRGKAYLPGIDTQFYYLTFNVEKIRGNNFEGVLKTMKPSDTTIRFDLRMEGATKDKSFFMVGTRVLYVKGPEQGSWKNSCGNCNPPEWKFLYEEGKFVIRGTVKNCDRECNWVRELSRDISSFDSADKDAVYALLDDNNRPDKAIFIAAVNKNPVVAEDAKTIAVSQGNTDAGTISTSVTEQRIAILYAGNIITKGFDKVGLIPSPQNVFVTNIPSLKISHTISIPQRTVLIPAGSITIPGQKNYSVITNSAKNFSVSDPTFKVSNTIYIPQRIALIPTDGIMIPNQKNYAAIPNSTKNFAIGDPALKVSNTIYIPQRIALITAGGIIPDKKNYSAITNPAKNFSVSDPTLKVSNTIYIPRRIVLIPANDISLWDQRNHILIAKQSPNFAAKKPSVKISNTISIPQRIALTPAGNIELLRRNKRSPIAQRTNKPLTVTTPYLVLPGTRYTIAKVSLPPVIKEPPVISTQKETIAKTQPLVLPEGFNERKKNVIETLAVNTDSITLRVYDNGVVDGDVVSVIYNNNVVIDKLSLTSRIVEVKIPVNTNAINFLVFHAHNLGQFPPNTAKLEIIYGSNRQELTVSSDLTASSTIDIVKK